MTVRKRVKEPVSLPLPPGRGSFSSLSRLGQGTGMPTEDEVARIVHENAGLVGTLVNRTLRLFPRLPGGYDRDDLRSLGYLGLLRAAQTFDSARGVAFSTYACRCIENAIARALKRESERQ